MKPTDPPPPQASAGQRPPPPGHGRPHHDAGIDHDAALENPSVDHEHSDVAVRPILVFVVGLAVVGIVVHVLMWLTFVWLERQAVGRDPDLSPLVRPATQMPVTTRETPVFSVGTGPQLLTDEPSVLREFRRREDERLHRYGWADQQTGVAHIPIDEAKRRLVERGLPARTDDEIDPRLGTYAPARGGSASGRTITMAPEAAVQLPAQREERQPSPEPPRGGHQQRQK